MHQESEHLIAMANEIALNISPGKSQEEAQEAVANHMSRFWPVSMQQQLLEQQLNEKLHPVVRLALQTLKPL